MKATSLDSEITQMRLLRLARIPMLLALLVATFLVLRVPFLQTGQRQAKAAPTHEQGGTSHATDTHAGSEQVNVDPVDSQGAIVAVQAQSEPENAAGADQEVPQRVSEPRVARNPAHGAAETPTVQPVEAGTQATGAGPIHHAQGEPDEPELTEEEIALRDLKQLQETVIFLLQWVQDGMTEHAPE